MEPLAHTLVGACLSEAGLKRVTPLAASTLIIAANIPDIDGACYLHSADLAFGFRRGLTHGVLAWVVLPVVLTAIMLAFDRLVRRRVAPGATAARPGSLLWLSALGVLTHPLLDWLNNYGVRLLMPFSDRWFYGDTLFIVDPWLWVILGGALMLACTDTRRGILLWTALAAATTLLIALRPLVPPLSRVAWLIALAVLVLARRTLSGTVRVRAAAGALVVAALYVATMYAGSRAAERQVRDLVVQRGWIVERVAAMPVPGDPFHRTVIAEAATQYVLIPVTWMTRAVDTAGITTEPRGTMNPVVEAALSLPRLQGTRRWLRFPSYQVIAGNDGGFRVIIRDARFSVGTGPGYGRVAEVELDRTLKEKARSPATP